MNIKEQNLVNTNRISGVVKFFNNTKGYGFVTLSSDVDAFVHYSQIEGDGFKSLNKDDKVTFELCDTTKGLQAVHVSRLQETRKVGD